MIHRPLGRTGLRVGALALGTVNFGWVSDERESFAVLDRALEVGIDLVDTADSYNGGESERILGRWLAQGGGRRERVVLATKTYRATGAGPNDRGLSARRIRAACEDSLRRLGTDHLDLYQMHHVDRSTPWEEVWQAMELLVRQGKVLYAGSSNFAGWHLATAQAHAARRGLLGLASEQSPYSLANRWVELEVLPACRELGIGFLPYTPLAEGVLAGGARAGVRRARPDAKSRPPTARLRAYLRLCAELGVEPAAVALAWLLSRPGVTAPIVGARTPRQVEGALHALEVTLGPEACAALDEIWPGPGGAAPEAYAW
jgi:aryl-alcohol dehydrogenase-like predicted oxidoreductase